MIKILHVITGLQRGGAEGALARLITAMDRSEFCNVVVSLRVGGAWAARLREAGVDVHEFNVASLVDAPTAFLKLLALLRTLAPDIVQSWLYHADLFAVLAKPWTKAKLAWNLRNSDLSNSRSSWRVLTWVLAMLSRVPDVIVCNAQAGLDAHRQLGYRPRRTLVIPNGIDTNYFNPLHLNTQTARYRLGLPPTGLIIGMAARFDRFKGFDIFFRAAFRVGENVIFAIAGTGVDAGNAALAQLRACAGASADIRLLGELSDPRDLYAAADVITLSSTHGEGFPNALGEAMACAKSVVGTDTGDVSLLVGEAGAVVAPNDPEALAGAWLTALHADPAQRRALGARARARIEDRFALPRAVAAYMALYRDMALPSER